MDVNKSVAVFQKSIDDYHLSDDVSAEIANPYPTDSFENLLYKKNWVDTVQWHLEDIIRNPLIDAVEGLVIKRRIDASNQLRTDLVESIDLRIQKQYENVVANSDAKINTETPAWAIDRLSILELKIYHMQAEVNRNDADDAHKIKCQQKLDILLIQRSDLCLSIQDLINDIAVGKKRMVLYRQMKMYNDESLNPVLYKKS